MKLPIRNKLTWFLLAIPLVLLLVCFGLRLSARGTDRVGLTQEMKPGEAGTKTLIVIVHGYAAAGNIEAMEGVRKAALQGQPGADVLMFGFSAKIFSNANPFQLADKMNREIERWQAKRNYEHIILCGYSMGALLIRKTYVYGCGKVADAPLADTRATNGTRMNWVDHVERFVLLAGMNRGFSPDAAPEHSTVISRVERRLGITLANFSGTGGLALQCMRGAPFVANLRLQWLDVLHASEEAKRPFPVAIQLLGLNDDVVGQSDSRDVTVTRGFIWVPLDNTNHAEMIKFGDSGSALERRQKVEQAFGNDEALAELRRLSPAIYLEQDDAVTAVVFVLHGIRDNGDWTTRFTNSLKAAYARQHPNDKLEVNTASYGHFGMGPFLLGSDRQKNVRWFMDQVTEMKAKYPKMGEPYFIGHSNGTYILGSALEKYVTLHLTRAVLAGCVLRRDYPWDHYTGRFEKDGVRNYVGYNDVVVGLAPKVFETWPFNLLNRDIGGAGFDGFEAAGVNAIEERFVGGEGEDAGHSAALNPKNVDSIVKFIIDGTVVQTTALHRDAHPKGLDLLSNLCWALWIVGVALLVVIGIYVPRLIAWLVAKLSPGWAARQGVLRWGLRCCYVAILLFVLKTI